MADTHYAHLGHCCNCDGLCTGRDVVLCAAVFTWRGRSRLLSRRYLLLHAMAAQWRARQSDGDLPEWFGAGVDFVGTGVGCLITDRRRWPARLAMDVHHRRPGFRGAVRLCLVLA